jgi:DNA-directed RNA polymerase specialized sigma24 family protein
MKLESLPETHALERLQGASPGDRQAPAKLSGEHREAFNRVPPPFCPQTLAGLRQAVDRLGPTDREVLTLRHFRRLSNREAAAALGISEEEASHQHVRALLRLQRLLGAAEAE